MRHSVAIQQSKRTFAEGEDVVVYDNRFKISSAGKITEVLGNNTYLADCGKGPQHVSGDCISRESDVATRQVGECQRVQPQHVRGDDDDGVDVSQQDDNMSMTSESSIGSDIVTAPTRRMDPAPAHRRRRRADQNLGPVQCGRRLRPRR